MNNIIELLGVNVPEEARLKGMAYEQPCRLERVPDENLKSLLNMDFNSHVYMDICHNP